MREFVEDNVFAVGRTGGAREDVSPRDDDRAVGPRLTEGDVGVVGDGAVGVAAGRDEGVGVDVDRFEFGVHPPAGAVEHEDARLGGDRDADLVCDLQPVATFESLFVEEYSDETIEIVAVLWGHTLEVWDIPARNGGPVSWEWLSTESGVAAFA